MNKVEIRKLILDAYLREGDEIGRRIDWSLIFHAILFEAFLAAHDFIFVQTTIGILGLIVAYLWLVIGSRQNWHMRHLIGALISDGDPEDAINTFFKRLTNIRNKNVPLIYGWIRATPVFSIIIPAIVTGAWLATLLWLFVVSSMEWIWYLLPLVILSLVTFLSVILTNHPKIDEEIKKSFFEDQGND